MNTLCNQSLRIRQLLIRILRLVVTVVVAALVLCVLWGVFTRFVLNDQASWSEELARMLLIWVVLLGSALAFEGNEHLGIDALIGSFHPDARRIMEMVSQIIIISFAIGVLGYGGILIVIETFKTAQVTSALQIPKGIIYLVLPISGVLTAFFATDNILQSSQDSDPEKEAIEQ